MKVYQIANWDRFMKADLGKCKGPLLWVATPTTHDGLGFLEMMAHPDGIRMYGGWHLILQTAAKCPERGVLKTDGGRPIGPREIALKTRAPEDLLQQTFAFCERIGWIISSGQHPDDIGIPSGLQDKQDKTNKTRQTRQDAPTGAEADCVGPVFVLRGGHGSRLTVGQMDTLTHDFPNAILGSEIEAALDWCARNPNRRPKSSAFSFMLNWLKRNHPKPAAPIAVPAERPDSDAISAARELEADLKTNGT